MDSISILIAFSLLLQLPLSLSQVTEFPASLHFPVTKDFPTGQYLTQIDQGENPLSPTRLVLYLGGPFVWLDCGASLSNSPFPLSCLSIECSAVQAHPCASTSSPKCALLVDNPITGDSATGELVRGPISAVDGFFFSCAPSVLLAGLPAGARGVFGFGKGRTGAPTQISHSLGYPQKFSLCLSPSNGVIFTGQEGIENEVSSKSLIYTPLLNGEDYSINLKGIKIQNKKLSLGKTSGTIKISTVAPYSKLETEIYGVFLRAFTMAAEAANMTRAPRLGQFEACYESGPSDRVPVIDLILQSEMVKWRIHGHNSMVRMRENVVCLGFLDGGSDLVASVVLGGHQMEDNLLEFDLGTSMLGFSNSLIMKKTSCSQLSPASLHRAALQSL